MKERSIHTISHNNAYEVIMPLLYGNVFHVTKDHNWSKIRFTGKLMPVPVEGEYESTFGSISYFRERGCVSLFDYRNYEEEGFERNFEKCHPLQPLNEDCPIKILFLSHDYYNLLIPWDVSKKDIKGNNIVPYVEVGVEGDVPLDYFYKVLSVSTVDDKEGFSYLLKQAERKKAKNESK
jgi:hypothetical protein